MTADRDPKSSDRPGNLSEITPPARNPEPKFRPIHGVTVNLDDVAMIRDLINQLPVPSHRDSSISLKMDDWRIEHAQQIPAMHGRRIRSLIFNARGIYVSVSGSGASISAHDGPEQIGVAHQIYAHLRRCRRPLRWLVSSWISGVTAISLGTSVAVSAAITDQLPLMIASSIVGLSGFLIIFLGTPFWAGKIQTATESEQRQHRRENWKLVLTNLFTAAITLGITWWAKP